MRRARLLFVPANETDPINFKTQKFSFDTDHKKTKDTVFLPFSLQSLELTNVPAAPPNTSSAPLTISSTVPFTAPPCVINPDPWPAHIGSSFPSFPNPPRTLS